MWNLSDPVKPVLTSTIQTAGPTGIAFSPRAPLLAAACSGEAGLCLWNLADPVRPVLEARLPTPASWPSHVSSMAISPDGTLLAAASERGSTLLWSIAQPAHPGLLADLPNPSKDDKLFAAVAFPQAAPFSPKATRTGRPGCGPCPIQPPRRGSRRSTPATRTSQSIPRAPSSRATATAAWTYGTSGTRPPRRKSPSWTREAT